jgi:hypothetical protein
MDSRPERDVEAFGDPCETVTQPAVAERDGYGEDVRPVPPRYAIKVANQLGEQVVGVELLDDQLQEGSRPREFRRARGEEPHRTRTNLLAPPLCVALLFGSNRVFLEGVGIGFEAELAHGCTSTTRGTHDDRSRAGHCGGPGPPARLRVG